MFRTARDIVNSRMMNSSKPLPMSVLLNNGVSLEELERFVKNLPDEKIRADYAVPLRENVSKGHWVAGLTCDERDVLLLHPFVKDVKHFCPRAPRFGNLFDFYD